MDIWSRWLVSVYALAFAIWSVIPLAEAPSIHFHERSSSEESISQLGKTEGIFLLSHNNPSYSGTVRTSGNNDLVHFFNEGTFQYVFLKNIFATAFDFLKAHDINFEFIDLIYPFHYFW